MSDHSDTGSAYSNSRYNRNDDRKQKIGFDREKYAQAQQRVGGSILGSIRRSVPVSVGGRVPASVGGGVGGRFPESVGGGVGGSVAGSNARGFSQPHSSRRLPSRTSSLSEADQGRSGYLEDTLSSE
jgi:hypothetical protein